VTRRMSHTRQKTEQRASGLVPRKGSKGTKGGDDKQKEVSKQKRGKQKGVEEVIQLRKRKFSYMISASQTKGSTNHTTGCYRVEKADEKGGELSQRGTRLGERSQYEDTSRLTEDPQGYLVYILTIQLLDKGGGGGGGAHL